MLHRPFLPRALAVFCSFALLGLVVQPVEAEAKPRPGASKAAKRSKPVKAQRSPSKARKSKPVLVAQVEPPAEGAPPAEEAPAEQAAPPPAESRSDAGAQADTSVGLEAGADLPTEDEPYFDEEVEVITVTVDRREKDLQKYAGSATAISQDEMDRVGISSVEEMGSAQPYAAISNQEGNTEVFVRGVGSDNNTELGDPAVANHVNGVYIPRPKGVGSMLFDIERMELNRGPQGTLRGRNATGGTLNIVTNKPEIGAWDALASLQMGNLSQRQMRGMLNIPLGDYMAFRLAAFGDRHAPYYENGGPIHNVEASESGDTLAYRASLRIVPVDAVTIDISQDYTQEGGTGSVGANFAPAMRAGIPPDEIPNPRSVVYRYPPGQQDMKHWGVGANTTLDFGPVLVGHTGSYRDLHFKQINGGAVGVAFYGQQLGVNDLDNMGTTYWNQRSQSTVQELRLFAPDEARLRWTVGGFFFHESQKTMFVTTADHSTGYLGEEWTMPEMKSYSWAGFTDATFDIIEQLRATAGVRITTESKRRTGLGGSWGFSGYDGDPVRFGTEGYLPEGYDRDTDPTPTADSFREGVDAFGNRDTIGPVIGQPGVSVWELRVQDGEYDDTFLDYRVGADADLSENNLVYLMFSTGHKSGGFNDQADVVDTAGTVVEQVAPTYKPETLYSTEIGSKNTFLDRAVTANVSAFWYMYRDQQFQVLIPLGAPQPPDFTQPLSAARNNVATSRYLGAEVDFRGQLPAHFETGISALLLDARFTEGTVADSRLGWSPDEKLPTDLKGNRVPRTSVLTVNYSLGQTIPTNIGYFDWLVGAQSKTEYFMTIFNGEGKNPPGTPNAGEDNPLLDDRIPGYTRFDIGVGYTPPSGYLRIDGFMNNVTNVAYVTSLINSPNLNLRYFNPPRTFGVRLTVYYPREDTVAEE